MQTYLIDATKEGAVVVLIRLALTQRHIVLLKNKEIFVILILIAMMEMLA